MIDFIHLICPPCKSCHNITAAESLDRIKSHSMATPSSKNGISPQLLVFPERCKQQYFLDILSALACAAAVPAPPRKQWFPPPSLPSISGFIHPEPPTPPHDPFFKMNQAKMWASPCFITSFMMLKIAFKSLLYGNEGVQSDVFQFPEGWPVDLLWAGRHYLPMPCRAPIQAFQWRCKTHVCQ